MDDLRDKLGLLSTQNYSQEDVMHPQKVPASEEVKRYGVLEEKYITKTNDSDSSHKETV